MDQDEQTLFEIHECVIRLRKHGVTPEAVAALQNIVLSSSRATQLYAQYIQEEQSLRWWAAGGPSAFNSLPDDVTISNDPLTDALIGSKLSPDAAAEEEIIKAAPNPLRPVKHLWNPRHLLSIAAILVIVITVTSIILSGPRLTTAFIATAVDARWDIAGLKRGGKLPAGQISLSSGFAEIHFENGVSIILEAPARFQITSGNSTDLLAGKLTAVVPLTGHGFTVQTNSGRVVDLGTEFGVEVVDGGGTSVEVFKGKVEAQPASKLGGSATSTPMTLSEGQAADLDPAGVSVLNHPVKQRFVRTLASESVSLDVVDFINGGDGTSQLAGAVIAPLTGRLTAPLGAADGDHQYHRVPELPAIDGSFVPDGNHGSDTVDSAGDTFQFPPTGNVTFAGIWAGIRSPWAVGDDHIVMGGMEYGLGTHRLIHVPSNSGFTLNLSLLRRLHPAANLASFHAIVGNSYDGNPNIGRADVFVLVNGQPRFTQRRMQHSSGTFTIDFPLKDEDTLITFASADGGDSNSGDWVHFVDPRIECRPK